MQSDLRNRKSVQGDKDRETDKQTDGRRGCGGIRIKTANGAMTFSEQVISVLCLP